MSVEAMAELERKFHELGDTVDVAELASFVNEPADRESVRMAFADIDTGNRGRIAWDDVVAYVLASAPAPPTSAKCTRYRTSTDCVDCRVHRLPVAVLQPCQDLNRLVSFDRNSTTVNLFSRDLRLRSTVTNAHAGELLSVDYVPGHEFLATSGADKTLCFWRFDEDDYVWQASQRWTLPRSQTAIRYCFGNLHSASSTGTVTTWSVARAERRAAFEVGSPVLHIGSWQDLLVVSAMDSSVSLWDAGHGEMRRVRVLRGASHAPVTATTCSARTQLLISTPAKGPASIWDVRCGSSRPVGMVTLESKRQSSGLVGVVDIPMTLEVGVADSTGGTGLFDLRRMAVVQQWSSWSAGLPRITAVAVVPGTSDLVVGGTRLVRYSRLDTTDSGTTSADDHGPILAVGYLFDVLEFVIVFASGYVALNALTGHRLRSMPAFLDDDDPDCGWNVLPGAQAACASVDTSKSSFWVGRSDGTLARIPTRSVAASLAESQGAVQAPRSGRHTAPVTMVAVDQASGAVASYSNASRTLFVHHGDEARQREDMYAVALAAGADLVLVANGTGGIEIYLTADLSLRSTLSSPSSCPIQAMAIVANGHMIVGGDDAGSVFLWKVPSSRTVKPTPPVWSRMDPTASSVTAICVDGSSLFCGDAAGLVQCADLRGLDVVDRYHRRTWTTEPIRGLMVCRQEDPGHPVLLAWTASIVIMADAGTGEALCRLDPDAARPTETWAFHPDIAAHRQTRRDPQAVVAGRSGRPSSGIANVVENDVQEAGQSTCAVHEAAHPGRHLSARDSRRRLHRPLHHHPRSASSSLHLPPASSKRASRIATAASRLESVMTFLEGHPHGSRR